MSTIGKIYDSVVLSSPRIEVMMRKFYWHNVKYLRKLNPFKGTHEADMDKQKKVKVDFEDVVKFLKENGVKKGTLLIIHSSYDVLACTGQKPDEIINRLLDLIGPEGTLAAPILREYKEMPSFEDQLKMDEVDVVCKFDMRRTPIKSGLIPFSISRRKDAVISPHPLNALGAIGPLAREMMEHNLDGIYPKPSGPNSCWKFCLDHHAIVVGLGVDLEHYNSMLHVAEEAFGNWPWPDEEWFRIRKFDVVKQDKTTERIEVYERKPKWGLLHLAERNLVHDLDKAGIYHRTKIGGVIPVCVEDAQEAIAFLQSHNKNGYPYFE